MRSSLSVFLLMILTLVSAPGLASNERCLPQSEKDPVLYRDDVVFVKTLKDAEANFHSIYSGGKRISQRAYRDGDSETYLIPSREGVAKIDPKFIRNLTRHMEIALERGYANYLVYSDMGHVHLIAPSAIVADLNKSTSPIERKERIFALNELKFLYHTGELFQFKQGDPLSGPLTTDLWLLWRYFSRNFLGLNTDSENVSVLYSDSPLYNTVRSIPDHQAVETIYMASSQNGCLPYKFKGETRYFDFSFEFRQRPVN